MLWDAYLPGFFSDTDDDENERTYISGEIWGTGYGLAALNKTGDFDFVNKLWDNNFPGSIQILNSNILIIENGNNSYFNPKNWLGVANTDGILLSNYLVDTTQVSNSQLLVTSSNEILYMNHPLLSSGIKKYKYIGPPDYLAPAPPDLTFHNYDSLCTDNITNDTIFLDGEVIVDLKEQESTESNLKLIIWPVPAIDYLHIEFAEGFKLNDKILIYNEVGVLINVIVCPAGANTMQFYISDFIKGTYFVVLQRKNNLICKGKFIL